MKLHEPIGRVQFVVLEEFMSADLSQNIAQEKSCDYLLTYACKNWSGFNFPLVFVTTCHPSLFLPTNDNLDQDWPKF